LIAFGCLAVGLEISWIPYRKEAAELQREQHRAFFRRFASPKELYQPIFVATFGGFWVALGIVFVVTRIIG
jgi:hypothetical protein